ncbi:MAG: hypothetical protein WCK89_10475, partial [bacterium]
MKLKGWLGLGVAGMSLVAGATSSVWPMKLGSENDGVIAEVRTNGTLQSLRVRYPDSWHNVPFRADTWA